ncbi:uncharacterized protein LOC122089709 [Macadamia integrifolia]|uniref:uncharacterized protein LOC122089709 n=1 Tax=Macadamia integrifolia TaxID=60698 RepID=UPI001C4FF45C|nr:uncharacterized protein LOC122089709 [Macadamia integrifolia]
MFLDLKDEIQKVANHQVRTYEPDLTNDIALADEVMRDPLPVGFRLPKYDIYDGKGDPIDHLEDFKVAIQFHRVSENIMCCALPLTFKAATRLWYNRLLLKSIHNFSKLSHIFVKGFSSIQPLQKTTYNFLSVKQQSGESLRDYMKCFHKAKLKIKGLDAKQEFIALLSGVKDKELKTSLEKHALRNLAQLKARCEICIHMEETLEADKEAEEKIRKKRTSIEENRVSKGKRQWLECKRPPTPPKKFKRYAPLNRKRTDVLMQIKDSLNAKVLKWPGKMGRYPKRYNMDNYCHFHINHGHNTKDCWHLKGEIESMIRRGYLGWFIDQEKEDTQDSNYQRDNR